MIDDALDDAKTRSSGPTLQADKIRDAYETLGNAGTTQALKVIIAT
jgi:hypothetical protein